jgi:hypothetical protein
MGFTLVCYFPLTRYFFAQDDFVFLERASLGLRQALESHFSLHPGHFRPLTKGLYFVVMWHLFGLNPFPYHVVSLVLHAVDSMLVGILLRRMGVSRSVSWAASLLFAVNLAHLVAVAWISCVQQLLGALFALGALIFGIDAMSRRSLRHSSAAVVAYVLALASYEQTLAVPLVLLAWSALRGERRGIRSLLGGPVGAMSCVLAVYVVYVFVLRGLPDSGPYAMSLGSNVIENLRAYTGSVYALWMTYPLFGLLPGFTASHAMWIVLGLVHVWRRTFRELAFGCITFLAFLAPVLCMSGHTEAFHMYLPAIGAWYVLASALGAIRDLVAAGSRRRAGIALALGVFVIAVGSVSAVERNIRNLVAHDVPLPRIFVLRRAVVAERVCAGVKARWAGEGKVFLLYTGSQHAANGLNVRSAIGEGSALQLVLGRPDLEVRFVTTVELSGEKRGLVLVINPVGDVYTQAEWKAMHRSQ